MCFEKFPNLTEQGRTRRTHQFQRWVGFALKRGDQNSASTWTAAGRASDYSESQLCGQILRGMLCAQRKKL